MEDSGNNNAPLMEISKDLFLTSDERYEVYAVKASERPHLLETYDNTTATSSGNIDDDLPLPLTDGCDIPRWRSEGMATVSPQVEAALNVGLGCPLLRQESQLPLPYTSLTVNSFKGKKRLASRWEQLQEKLMHKQPVTETVERISCSQASQYQPMAAVEEKKDSSNILAETKQPRYKTFSKLEEDNYPVIIDGCTEGWNLPAWNYPRLVERFGDIRWRFSDTHGAMMTLETYAKYAATEGRTDDSPLAVYDSEFGDSDSPMHELVKNYITPPCFSDDLFALAVHVNNKSHSNEKENYCETICNHDPSDDPSDSNPVNSSETTSDSDSTGYNDNTRPPWRWILMGPPRSGTGLHIDPLWTNAWVTLLEGTKRWILIPPYLQSQLPDGAGLREPQVPSVMWFRDYYDEVIQLDGVVEILQRPGETVFVPNGWPHLVLNLERTVAVTHNYASEFGPFERMWEQVLEDEPDFAQRWYRGLCLHRPDLASRIHSCKPTASTTTC